MGSSSPATIAVLSDALRQQAKYEETEVLLARGLRSAESALGSQHAVTAGGSLFGIAGAYLAVPVTAVVAAVFGSLSSDAPEPDSAA